MKNETVEERIARCVTVDPETGCWNWTLVLSANGYGKTTIKYKQWSAHRLSYVTFVGEIPEGLHVCHRCDNRQCVNPEHLFVGTPKDNAADCKAKGRTAKYGKQWKSKLSEKDVADIIRRAVAGERYTTIANDYGVARTTISQWGRLHGIQRGMGWANRGVGWGINQRKER